MKCFHCLSAWLLLNLHYAFAEEKVVICYYGTWASYRSGLGKFEIANIPTSLCTHLVYTFMGIDYAGRVTSLDPYLDYTENWGKGYLQKFNALKKNKPNLKTILAVGGFNEGSSKYSLMAGSPTLRKTFIASSMQMVTKYGFDGLEVDWEYPNRGDSVYGQDDVDNFSELLKELREEVNKRGLLLTAAVAAPEQFASLSYNVSALSRYLDYISIMGYDMYGPWNTVTGHNAPLHRSKTNGNTTEGLAVDVALQYWLNQGCPAKKLVLGMPLYGRTFTLTNAKNSSVGAPSSGPGLVGPYTQTRGVIGFNELCHKIRLEVWDVRRDNVSLVPYAVQGRNWVSYDDPNSLTAKVDYGMRNGIAGVMVWSIETDDFHGICFGEYFPLLRSVNKALGKSVYI